MGLKAFNAGCNVIAIEKNNRKYAMTCAWASMVAYDKVGLLIGSQSETGKILTVGDICGISALADDQLNISNFIGETHSTEVDKFKDIKYTQDQSAIFIDDAKVLMKVQVAEIVHFKDIEEDNYVVFNVLSAKENQEKKFLSF
ncbi:MAG: flavin reductase [Bacilli bacterium]|nr:flavin reductase [Bacilli bacterium]